MSDPSLRDTVLPYLRGEILSGALTPGTRLNEATIAQHLGVSRSPVREAMAHLEQEGLVERFPNRGVFVLEVLTPRAVEEMASIRSLLETYAIQHIAREITREDLADLYDLTMDMDLAAAERDWSRIADVDRAFHLGLMILADHRKLLHLWNEVATQYWAIYLPRIQRLGHEIDHWGRNHRFILDAIVDGKTDVAVMYLQSNILRSAEEFVAELGESDHGR